MKSTKCAFLTIGIIGYLAASSVGLHLIPILLAHPNFWVADASADEAPEGYLYDPDFPDASEFTFDKVWWTVFDQEDSQLVVLQRSDPQISFWSRDGKLIRKWPKTALVKPHSVTLEKARDGERYIWVTDLADHCIKKFSYDGGGQLIHSIGKCGTDSQGTGINPVQFDRVTDVAFDSNGHMYVTDGDKSLPDEPANLNNRVLVISPTHLEKAEDVWSVPNNGSGDGPKEFLLPHVVQVDQCKRVWVADTLNHRVQAIGSDGTYLGELSCFGDEAVYGLHIAPAVPEIGVEKPRLFVTTGSTNFLAARGGNVYVFDLSMNCKAPKQLARCNPVMSWSIKLPKMSPLHAITVDPHTHDIYISTLEEAKPPQVWRRWYRSKGLEQ